MGGGGKKCNCTAHLAKTLQCHINCKIYCKNVDYLQCKLNRNYWNYLYYEISKKIIVSVWGSIIENVRLQDLIYEKTFVSFNI